MKTLTVKVGNRELPVAGYVTTRKTGTVPVADAPMMSDYRWHQLALKSRLKDPEFYRTVLSEDVAAEIAQLRQTLAEYDQAMKLKEAI